MKIRIAFIGGGGHARSITDSLNKDDYEVVGIYDQNPNADFGELKFLGSLDDVLIDAQANVFDKVFVSIGSNKNRTNVLEAIAAIGDSFLINLISKSAYVSQTACLEGKNIFIGQFAYIGPKAKLGHNSMVNTGSILEHDSVLGANSSIATQAVVNGMCRIGDNTTIATGVVVIEAITIHDTIVVGAGAVVVKDLTESGTYLGIPAKLI